jgi:hypothetical protein
MPTSLSCPNATPKDQIKKRKKMEGSKCKNQRTKKRKKTPLQSTMFFSLLCYNIFSAWLSFFLNVGSIFFFYWFFFSIYWRENFITPHKKFYSAYKTTLRGEKPIVSDKHPLYQLLVISCDYVVIIAPTKL